MALLELPKDLGLTDDVAVEGRRAREEVAQSILAKKLVTLFLQSLPVAARPTFEQSPELAGSFDGILCYRQHFQTVSGSQPQASRPLQRPPVQQPLGQS